GFVLTAILNTFLPIPDGVSSGLVQIGKFMIVMAMTAIGLNTNLKKLLTNGLKPICLGLCCWFVVAVVSLLVQHFIGML
ncbi:MAG: putative sulfate exporter family transporter, partial [Firmicutes bacterium]|nr:putative sulfate exporter family transporter [Bacillota bacterium]